MIRTKTGYALTCAVAIILSLALMELIFSISGNYESLPVRLINLLFILIGFIIMVYQYAKHHKQSTSYTEAAKLCLRAGVYFMVIFFPLAMIGLQIDPADVQEIQLMPPFSGQPEGPLEILGMLFIEVPVFIVIATLTATSVVGFVPDKSIKNENI